MRRLLRDRRGHPLGDLARELKVSYTTIFNAARGRTWKHLSEGCAGGRKYLYK